MLKLKFAPLVLLLCLFVSPAAWPQAGPATAEIHGTISDQTGAVVPGASVTATLISQSFNRSTVSDSQGEYSFLALSPGDYSIEVQSTGFGRQVIKTNVTVGQTAVIDLQLTVTAEPLTVDVETNLTSPVIEQNRSQQSNTIREYEIHNLPIDRRDYLTFSLLAPGVADSNALADNTDYRVAQTPQSGLSFYGSNGRGNSVTVDGAEANDVTSGVRFTLSQEAVQEFQINRSNYNAELGGAAGGVINVVSKSGGNTLHGGIFGFFRNDVFDAADPFAIDLVGNRPQRIKPSSNREQYGATLGGPIAKNRTFFFGSYEGMDRNESSAVPVLTDMSIFNPTASQLSIINALATNPSSTPIPCLPSVVGLGSVPPATCAAVLANTLSSKPSTVDLFKLNSGVFPFRTRSRAFSGRLDHLLDSRDQLMFRYSFQWGRDENQSTRALVGFTRSYNVENLDSNALLRWTRVVSAQTILESRFQWNYRKANHLPNDLNGPEINIPGYGFFDRDVYLPNYSHLRRYEAAADLTHLTGNHRFKVGGSLLERGTTGDPHVFFGGSFSFGSLPGGVISPQLATTGITALQAFDLGLPQSYVVGFGVPRIAATLPYVSFYAQDTWNLRPDFTLNIGARYEYDDRLKPVPTDKNNFAPRIGFGWDPFGNRKTTVRGGYGIYYAQTSFSMDFVANTVSEIDGYRPIAQVLTVIDPADPFSRSGPINIFQTLRAQGVVGIPRTTRQVTQADLAQFGIVVSNRGPRPPLSLLFQVDPNFRSNYSQQASLGIEQELSRGTAVSVSYIFSRSLKIPRSRDVNLLPAPKNALGIRDWSSAPGAGCAGLAILSCFRDPLLLGLYNFESTATASFNGLALEAKKRFGRGFGIDANYTFSKAIDDVVDYNSAFSASDQANLRAERALSSFDERHKAVVYAAIESPFHRDNANSVFSKVIADFLVTPIFRANSARPFNLLAGVDLNSDRNSQPDRPPFAGRNTGIGPNFWTLDMRLTRRVLLHGDRTTLELTAEGFNLLNRLNFASVNNTVGPAFAPPFRVHARSDVGPSSPLGYTSAFDPRRIQLGFHLSF